MGPWSVTSYCSPRQSSGSVRPPRIDTPKLWHLIRCRFWQSWLQGKELGPTCPECKVLTHNEHLALVFLLISPPLASTVKHPERTLPPSNHTGAPCPLVYENAAYDICLQESYWKVQGFKWSISMRSRSRSIRGGKWFLPLYHPMTVETPSALLLVNIYFPLSSNTVPRDPSSLYLSRPRPTASSHLGTSRFPSCFSKVNLLGHTIRSSRSIQSE